ncbi:MAG: hypothetical protein LWX52_13090 [Deltaproteobacteria bacterium]|jgi:hypothetical protein|nr:hypothetical protein [Deltaproteobacteria bacterium]
MIWIMLFTQKQMSYLAELPSMVAQPPPKAPNPDVPFFIDDPVVYNYETLRSVCGWNGIPSSQPAKLLVEHRNEVYQKRVRGSVLKTVRNGLKIIPFNRKN